MHKATLVRVFPPTHTHSHDSGCGLLAWGLAAKLNKQEMVEFERLIEHHHKIKQGRSIFRAGDPLNLLYAVTGGSFKTCRLDRQGRLQIAKYSLPGDLIGIEAIDSDTHPCDVIALEDSQCCGIRFSSFIHLSHRVPALQYEFLRVLSNDINRHQELMNLLSNVSAEGRIAQYVLTLSERCADIGRSSTHLKLTMRRKDIGSYLGLKVETVSRVLSQLKEKNILDINYREIEVKSFADLQTIAGDNCRSKHKITSLN